LRARTHFRRYRGCRVQFSCFPLIDMFSAVTIASGPIFLFCTSVLVFGVTDGVRSRFLFLRAWTHFRRYRGRPVLFTCFAVPDMFSAVSRATCPIFMFCSPRLMFGGTEGVRSRFHVFCTPGHVFDGTDVVGSRFHVLRAGTRVRRYRGCRVPFSCFALPESFLAVPGASGPVFMFCAPGLIFGGTEVVGSRFHVLRARTRFR
jgi:hypothetical protein